MSAVSLAGNSAKVTFSVDRSIVVGDQSLAAIRTDTILGALHRGQSGWLRQVDHDSVEPDHHALHAQQGAAGSGPRADLNRPQFEQALNVFTQALHDATPQVRGAVDGLTSLSRA